MLVKRIIVLLLFLSTTNSYVAAQEGNVWCFGYHSGLDFNYSPPKVISTYAENMFQNQTHYSTSISDCRGNLLFYVSDNLIRNKLHKVMPNGTIGDTTNYVYSFVGNMIIVPFPDDTSKYYLFYSFEEYKLKGYYYAVIDMTKDSGRGEVDTMKRKVFVSDWNYNRESTFIVTQKSGTRNHWLVQITPNSDTIKTFIIDDNGVNSSSISILFNRFKIYYNSVAWHIGTSCRIARFNHGGDKIVTCIYDNLNSEADIAFLSFNNKTGKVSILPKLFKDTLSTDALMADYINDMEFSLNDLFVYISRNFFSYWGYSGPSTIPRVKKAWISQYETNVNDIKSSAIEVQYFKYNYDRIWGVVVPYLQIGPDNKIYALSDTAHKCLDVINFPNNKGKSCEYSRNNICFDEIIAKEKLLSKGGWPLGWRLPDLYFPVHSLNCSVESGCKDSFLFTNQSDTGYFKSFVWYFGDGDSSTLYAPYHKYTHSGKYEVKLRGENECGAYQWFSDSIEVHTPPHAAFVQDTFYYTCTKAYIQLTSTAKEKDILLTLWNWGDSTKQDTGSIVNHSYDSSGIYIIQMVVLTPSCADTLTDTLHVVIDSFPQAGFTFSKDHNCAPANITFNGTSLHSSRLQWLVDDMELSRDTDFNHLFTDTGRHIVTLVAYNAQGCSDTLSQEVYIASPPVAQFNYKTDTLCGGIQLMFSADISLRSTYSWDLGDSTSDSGRFVSHTYTSNADYLINLTVSNGYCDSVLSQRVNIRLPQFPKAAFLFSQDTICLANSVKIIDHSTGTGLSYSYKIDSLTYLDKEPTFLFADSGIHQVSLKIMDRYGCEDSIVESIRVLPWPKASFMMKDSSNSCDSRTYIFKNTSTGATHYFWNFGDSAVDNHALVVSHKFTTGGNYTVKLTASNGSCEDTFSIILPVKLRPLPAISFKMLTDSTFCSQTAIRWVNTSQNADSFVVDYGDGTVLTLSSADTQQYVYKAPGTHNMVLRGYTAEGCTAMSRKVNIRVLDSLSARIHRSRSEGCSPLTIDFSNIGHIPPGVIPQYFWQTSDGRSSTEAKPTFVFHSLKDTLFQVKLTLKAGSCIAQDSISVQIYSISPTTAYTRMAGATVTADNQHILIQWYPLKGATTYRVERKYLNTDFMLYSTVKDTFLLDNNVKLHTQYQYRITGMDDCGNLASASSLASNIVLRVTRTEPDTSAELKWSSYESFLSGVRTYRIQRQQPTGWQTLDSSSSLAFSDPDFMEEAQGEQCYKVVAVENGGGTYLSQSNEECLIIPLQVFVPNIFTPNVDGINEVFRVRGTGLTQYHLEIYNRWGERVFITDDIHESWNGNNAIEGVYHYMIYARGKERNIFKKGNITLLR